MSKFRKTKPNIKRKSHSKVDDSYTGTKHNRIYMKERKIFNLLFVELTR